MPIESAGEFRPDLYKAPKKGERKTAEKLVIPERSRNKKAAAVALALSAMIGTWLERGPDESKAASPDNATADQQVQIKQKALELVRAISDAQREDGDGQENETVEVHGLNLTNEDFVSFPNQDAQPVFRFFNIDRRLAQRCADDPEFDKEYHTLVDKLKFENDDTSTFVYNPDDPEFNLVYSVSGDGKSYEKSLNDAPPEDIAGSPIYHMENASDAELLRDSIRQDLEEQLYDYLEKR